jgi:hypothetical protein
LAKSVVQKRRPRIEPVVDQPPQRKRKLKTVTVKGSDLLTEALAATKEKMVRGVERSLERAARDMTRGTGEKVKTSFYIDHSVLADAKFMARGLGVSFNAYVSMALFNMKNQLKNGGSIAMSLAAPMDAGILRPSTPPPPAKDPLRKFGSGFTLPASSDDDDACYASWDDCRAYLQEVERRIDKNRGRPIDASDWIGIARAAGIQDMDTARAADAAQGSQLFHDYLRALETR